MYFNRGFGGMVEGLGGMIPDEWEGAARCKKRNCKSGRGHYRKEYCPYRFDGSVKTAQGVSVSTIAWDITDNRRDMYWICRTSQCICRNKAQRHFDPFNARRPY